MSKLIQAFLTIVFSFLALSPTLSAQCKLCEDIRERNRQHPSEGYAYYEDYLEAKGVNKQENQKTNNAVDKNNEDQKAPQKR